MADDAEAMELLEQDLERLIMVGRKEDITYPQILYCILHRLSEMVLQCQAEQWLEHKE